jgi:heme A synthase
MPDRRFTRYAWIVLSALLAVIAWGAYVRASGSGAGCGSHWPLCNGVVLPRSPRIATLVEFAHRSTSGLAFLLVAGLAVWAWRALPAGHPARASSFAALAFMVTESAIGAGLVLLELVATDKSAARIGWLALHLVNTFFLVAAIALAAWWSNRTGIGVRPAAGGRLVPLAAIGAVLMLVLGVTGAIAALGDTLFPAGSLAAGIQRDFEPTAHLALRLRVLHPVLAVATGLYLMYIGIVGAARTPAARVGRVLAGLVAAQWIVGAVNLLLLAPIPLQLVHLVLADLVWVALVLLLGEACTAPAAEPAIVPSAGLAAARR